MKEMKEMKEMKGLKGLMTVLILTLFAALFSCSTIDCPLNHNVATRFQLMKPDGNPDTLLTDTMWVLTTRMDGTDTLLLNRLCGNNATGFSLPISHILPEDAFLVLMRKEGQTEGYYYDSIIVKKEDTEHFESVDCQPSFFHKITGVRCKEHFIDSVVINNPDVNYDTKTPAHIRLYLNPDF